MSKANRDLFLKALRSGDYPKGPITEEEARKTAEPCWCAVGLAHTLFVDHAQPNQARQIQRALKLTPKEVWRIQNEWNDSPLTFPEIADRIESEIFHVTDR